MLGKTANGLFWMYRYFERAENTARLIETGQRIALTRLDAGDDEWVSVLQSAGALTDFEAEAEGNPVTRDEAVDWLLRSGANASSVLSCIEAARQNARLVRTALTGEVWEATNATYMTARRILARKVSERDLPETLRTIRQHAALVRGMTLGTMMRTEIFNFARIGTFLERADSTARILDVKYYVLLPSAGAVGTSIDNVQWETILRSVSARGGFRLEYGAAGGPLEIAEFLILNKRMPRSLAFCAETVRENLLHLQQDIPDPLPSLDLVDALLAECLSQDIGAVFDFGLHEFIETVLAHLARIARQIEIDFRFYE
ncbi:Uncharacterized conserved protein, Alpha-E superfamily [Cribrihabitans marinus]|uniref:Uncharacterized conserved protein, Alpha-E superfamily n=1 Tax=Cribrihabitans marinus TaxID=1227549 RepID=A0A1H6UC96_9RHOB|nr:alpha-E domain-containing protein [Cribrihabitans marinus]GGH21105.1 hypothetical protein GCM10010973_05480 [Cribrihabitans marinus]SEI85472.1 Uncharacterized conserved protein, Alpha-E superfamily [Cribrihabitans marinus]